MNFNLLIYKYRFFIGYILIGIFSIFCELISFNILNLIFSNTIIITFASVIIGIVIAFMLNVNYNFKISRIKRNRALIYFFIISFSSYFIQIIFISEIQQLISYEFSRILISGSFFWIAYLIHRKYSFRDFKKVGVAIYADGVEDVENIFNKVENYPDFIHIDIVDKTMNENSKAVLSYKTEVIKAFWNKKFIETHIMSLRPLRWILKIAKNVDRIYVHTNLEVNLEKVLKTIRENNCQAGIVIQKKSEIEILNRHVDLIDSVLVLCIKKPGVSGQKFQENSFDLIKSLNNHKNRNRFSLNVDGGVYNKNISKIKSENVVSGSYVLNSKNPIRNIMILQTSSQYEQL